MIKFTAPQMDRLLSIYQNRNLNPEGYHIKTKEKLEELYILLDKIKSVDETDEIKILYFSVEKGTIDKYGDYEEVKEDYGISSYKEFEKYFNEEYPDDIYWYRLVAAKYKNYITLSINNKNIINANLDEEGFEDIQFEALIDFLIYKVSNCIKMLEDNTYNDYISKNLSYKNRFGVIKRIDYWKLYPEVKERLLEDITEEEINEFIENAEEKTTNRIENMTSGKYFECVRLAYQNNNYDLGTLSDKELYLKYADGRDEGLTDINLDSKEEFDDWYNNKDKFGGHPWEIMRGHSFYRVNLYISHDDKGYYLRLDGNKILRKIEIAKIYLSLTKNNIPIEIYDVDIIKKALTGEDYIGIVPSYIAPVYCGSYFKKYKPLEFIHIHDDKILDYIKWEDIEKVYLK